MERERRDGMRGNSMERGGGGGGGGARGGYKGEG